MTPTPRPPVGLIPSRGQSASFVVVRRDLTGALPKQIVIGRPGGHRVAKRGWIVILASIPTNNGRGAAVRFARGARGDVGGLSVLNSSNRRPLRGGYWVVYSGPYSTLAAVSRRAGRIHAAGYRVGLHPRADHVPVRRLKTCLRAEEGMTLIELLIAMTVMSIGIAALVAGFSSGIVSINRARTTSTAGTLADQQMELYRQASFASLPTTLQSPTTPTAARTVSTYWMQSRRGPGRARSARIPPAAVPAPPRAVRSSS